MAARSMNEADALRTYVCTIARAYVRQVGAMSYGALCANQLPPWGSIKLGTAGIACALSRPGPTRLRLLDLDGAQRWAAAAEESRDRRALLGNEGDLAAMDVRGSLYFGREGVALVGMLVTARRGRAIDPKRLRALLRRFRQGRGSQVELMFGAAGLLTGLLLLHAATREPSVLAAATMLAEDLLERGRSGWTRMPALNFAHGRAGVFHALLRWSRDTQRALPAWFHDELDRFDADIATQGRMGAQVGLDDVERSWCNGASGLVLLWTRAYELAGEARHRVRARRAARFILTRTKGFSGDLCCGLGGRAFALLAMDRVEPGRGWDLHAARMAKRAADALLERPGERPNALFGGFPGLVCLARDLAVAPSHRVGFPLVDA